MSEGREYLLRKYRAELDKWWAEQLREHAKQQRRVWFHRPQLPRRGWASWRPWWRSSDEFGRRTLVIGPDLTGSVVIAYRICDCEHCVESRRQTAEHERTD